MRVFLTGATGFIGSHVARRLVAEGCEVHALIRPGSDTRRVRDVLPALAVVHGDLFAFPELAAALERIRPELCVHLAWYAEPGRYLRSPENLRCLAATLELANRLAGLGCQRFVGAGTCFEYDTEQGYLSEASRTGPRSLYAASKLGAWLVLEQLAALAGMSAAWVRFFYQYGPFEDERRLVPAVIRALLRGETAKTTAGAQVRDMLHVEDVASAVWAVARGGLTGPVNIGSGQPVTVRRIVETVGDLLGRPELLALGALPYGAGDPPFVCADNRRLCETGWAPRFDLNDGLRHTIDWWRTR
jgi:nucleoside-diphosphate-sugar epimerase